MLKGVVAASKVLVDRLQPTDVIMGVRDQVNCEGADGEGGGEEEEADDAEDSADRAGDSRGDHRRCE